MVLCQLQPHLQLTRTTSLRRVSNAKLPIHHHCAPKETVLVGTKASNNEKPNASGFTPDQTRALPERSVDPDGPEALIIRCLRELYSCKGRNRSYEIYTHDAVFHDPIGIACGVDSIRARFDALPKLFPRCDVQKLRVLENPPGTHAKLVLIDLVVAYFRDAQATSPFEVINSLVTLQLDDANQITRHTEEWDHNRETTADDGFLGMLKEQRKRMTAAPTNLFMFKL